MGHLLGDDDGKLDDAGNSLAGAVGCVLVPGSLMYQLALSLLADGVRVGDAFGEDAGDYAAGAVIVAAEHAAAPHVSVDSHGLFVLVYDYALSVAHCHRTFHIFEKIIHIIDCRYDAIYKCSSQYLNIY